MKTLFMTVTAVVLFSVGFVLAQTNVPPAGTPEVPLDPLQWANLIITALTPIVIAGIKWVVPKIPRQLLPFLAPVVGVILDQTAALVSAHESNVMLGALAGGLGVWLREAVKQSTKFMKPAVPLLIAGTLLGGCATLQLERIESKARGVAFMISAKLLQDNPTWRDSFVQASADLKFVSEREIVDVAMVMGIISRLPKLQSGDAAIFIHGALIIFTDELNSLAVKNPEEVRLAARGFYSGIDLALGFVVPKSLKPPASA